jgi:hypothetical protein
MNKAGAELAGGIQILGHGLSLGDNFCTVGHGADFRAAEKDNMTLQYL